TPTLSRLQDMLTSSVPIVGAMTRQGHIQWREGRRDLYGSHPELGIYFWPNGNVGSPPQDYMVFPECHIDIDYEADYHEAQRTPQLRSICFPAAEPTTWTGTGHHRRMETLRMSLQAYPETENPGMDDIHI